MSQLQDRFVTAGELTPEQTWRLVEWCAEHGADEFTIAMLSLEGSSATFLEHTEVSLKPFERSIAPRKRVTVLAGQPPMQPTKLWALTTDSIAVLKGLFANGVFTKPSYGEQGWLEDPTLYRADAIILGIVSHESEGVLTLTENEHAQIAAMGIRTRGQPQWI